MDVPPYLCPSLAYSGTGSDDDVMGGGDGSTKDGDDSGGATTMMRECLHLNLCLYGPCQMTCRSSG